MTAPEVRYFILQPGATRPIEPPVWEVEHNRPRDARDFAYGSAEVAPGVRVRILGSGQHWYGGMTIEGTLIAVQDTTGARP